MNSLVLTVNVFVKTSGKFMFDSQIFTFFEVKLSGEILKGKPEIKNFCILFSVG